MKKESNMAEEKLDSIKQILSNLLVFELCKAEFTRGQIRKVVGRVSNAQVSKINSILKSKKKNK